MQLLTLSEQAVSSVDATIICLVPLTACQVKLSKETKDFGSLIYFAHFRSSQIVI